MESDHNIIGTLGRRILNNVELRGLKHYWDIPLIVSSYQNFNCLFFPSELFMIKSLSESLKDMDGEYAEAGVWEGCSARIIAETKGKKKLFLFDTFEGLPAQIKEYESDLFEEGMYESHLGSVKEKFKEYKDVFIYKGLFPKETGKLIEDKRFAFVHLDLDIYKSTKEALEFFYPRMINGGVIISHDSPAEGIKRAFAEFFNDKKENPIKIINRYFMVIKQNNH